MPVLIAVFLSWQAALKVSTLPARDVRDGQVFVSGRKARVEVGDVVAIWDGAKLRVKIGKLQPREMDPSLRSAFGVPPDCLEKCGYAPVGQEMVDGVLHRIFEKVFDKTPMGPLRQRVWMPPDGPPRRMLVRSARGATRMELSSIRTAPRLSEKLFTFR